MSTNNQTADIFDAELFVGDQHNLPHVNVNAEADDDDDGDTEYESLLEMEDFDDQRRLLVTSVIIPDEKTLTSIQYGAFYNTSITTLAIPNGVLSISESAFNYCRSLRKIVLPQSLEVIGENAFYSCGALSSITVPPSVTTIQGYVFSGCSSLKSIIISDETLNDRNFGISVYSGRYCDPFEGCTELEILSALQNMTVKQYLIHLNKEKEDRIRRRVAVLTSLQSINTERIAARDEGRYFIWAMTRLRLGDDEAGVLNGVLAEDKITAFELWREVCMYM